MHPELEALLRAYDAAQEASGEEAAGLSALFEDRLEEALAKRSGLNRETLRRMVRRAHWRRLRAQERQPSTLPPTA